MLTHALVLLTAFTSRPAVYVKGHSQAAVKARAQLQASTCYRLADRPEVSDAVLEVDHVLTRSGDRQIVMVLLGWNGRVLWEGKTTEDPWPLPSPVNRLLRRLAKSSCSTADVLAIKSLRPIRDPSPIVVK